MPHALAPITLREEYERLRPGFRVVYVFPDIIRSSRYNPYLSLLYRAFLTGVEGPRARSPHPLLPLFIVKRCFGEKSILHYHWLGFGDLRGFLVLGWKLLLVMLYTRAGGAVVWTVHNRTPHEGRYRSLNRAVRRWAARSADRLHVHCAEAVRITAPELRVPENRFFIVPHPEYPVTIIPAPAAREKLCRTLGVTLDMRRPLFLVYGQIAAYKGIIEMVEAFADTGGRLLVVGGVKKGEREYAGKIAETAARAPNIHLHIGFVDRRTEAVLLNAADWVVFNFRDILASGSVVLARSYHRPVIVPDIGCCRELDGAGIRKFSTMQRFREHVLSILGT